MAEWKSTLENMEVTVVNMRVLVTGHKGYVGTILIPILQAKGYEIAGLDIDLYVGHNFVGNIRKVPYLRKDIRDIVPSDLKGFDAVVHLAALSNDPLGNFNPEITYNINFHASVKLAKLAKKVGVQRFLFSSSCSVYGASNGKMMTEEEKPNPITPYGVSKLLAEDGISKLADSKFSPTFLRFATAYGVSTKIRSDLVLNNIVGWAYITGKVLLKSDGTPWRPIIHVEDFSKAFIAVLNAPRDLVHNQIFNVGTTKENYQMRELAEIVKKTVHGSRIEYAEDAGPDKRNYRADCSKLARTLPEFRPKWNVRCGVKQLYEVFKKSGLTSIKEFEGPPYNRIAQIKKLISTGHLDKTLRWSAINT